MNSAFHIFSQFQQLLLLSGVILFAVQTSNGADEARATGLNKVSTEQIAEGTRFVTDMIIRQSDMPGPVVLVVGGMHGNEPAGAFAAKQISQWEIAAGTLIVIPEANRPALKTKTRYTPEADKAVYNLNRNFIVGEEGVSTTGVMAPILWNVVEQFSPDWVIDLHEGYDFTRINPKSVGSSVIAGASAKAKDTAEAMIAVVDTEITDVDRKFKLRGPPVKGSLTRAAATDERHVMIVETTSKAQSLAVRARQHRLMMATVLNRLQMLGPKATTPNEITEQFVKQQDRPKTNIALFDDAGVFGKGIPSLSGIWADNQDVTVHRICAADVRAGALLQFDLLCCSGGSGGGQGKALQESGRQIVRSFVEGGGDYIGICGGAYLACENFSWGLGILDAGTKKGNWRRGRATLPVAITDEGRRQLNVSVKDLPIFYANGPILRRAERPDLPDFQVLATFEDEVAENESPKGIMTGSPAIVLGNYGAGQVYVLSPHPESTSGATFLIESLTQQIMQHNHEGAVNFHENGNSERQPAERVSK